MDSISAEAILQRYEILPERSKREVSNFIDFMMQKRRPRKKKIDKKKLLAISYWDDEDIEAIEDAGKP